MSSTTMTATVTRSRWQRLHLADEALLVMVRGWERPLLTRIMRAFTRMGDASSWVFAGLWLIGAGATRQAALLGFGALIATVASQVVKRMAGRPRPDLTVHGLAALTEHPDRFSFPSGHTCAAFAVAVAVAGEGAAASPVWISLACAIATSRVYLGAHYPLDVAVGAVLGSVAGLVARVVVG